MRQPKTSIEPPLMSQEEPNGQVLEDSQAQPLPISRPSPRPLTIRASSFKGETEVDAGPFRHKGNTPRSRIPKQQTVTGHALTQFGPEQVIVYNKGPVSVELGYDGQDYSYPAGEYRTVPALVAFFHWGVIALADPQSGELNFSRPKGAGSQFEDRLSGYAPLTLWQKSPDDYERFIEWYTNGLEFKVFRPKTRVRSQDWAALGTAIS